MVYANTMKQKPLQDLIAVTCPLMSLPVPEDFFPWLDKGTHDMVHTTETGWRIEGPLGWC